MSAHDAGPPPGVVRRGMRSTVGRESTTFGFSILVTAAFGLLQTMRGSPDVGRVFLFAIGAVASFTVLEAVLSRGFRGPMPQHDSRVLAVGTSMNLLSVVGGLGLCWVMVRLVPTAAVWAVATFLGAVAYLLLESAETAVAERVAARTGDADASEVTP